MGAWEVPGEEGEKGVMEKTVRDKGSQRVRTCVCAGATDLVQAFYRLSCTVFLACGFVYPLHVLINDEKYLFTTDQ